MVVYLRFNVQIEIFCRLEDKNPTKMKQHEEDFILLSI